MKNKFYVNAEGRDNEAYNNAIQFAYELSQKDPEIKRVVLLIDKKENTGLFEGLFDSKTIKQLFIGIPFIDGSPLYKFETMSTYEKSQIGNQQDIVICCALDSDDIFKIDEHYSAKYIISIPWLKRLSEKWIKTWDATEISGKKDSSISKFLEPTAIVKKAMVDLTKCINMSTGLNHPFDNERVKTFVRALHKYENELNADIIGSYLVRELNWDPSVAKEIEKLINTLNQGRFFKGGEKTGLQNYYKRWKEECEGEQST